MMLQAGTINRILAIIFFTLLFAGVAQAKDIEVAIIEDAKKVNISSEQSYYLSQDGTIIAEFPADSITKVMAAPKLDADFVIINGKHPYTLKSPIAFMTKEAGIMKINNRSYKGKLKLIKPFTVINELDIEDYLKGVVPSEMPYSWHEEALKAQSVCARTYTITNLNRRRNLGYDLKATVEDQVYLGYDHERESSNKAIEETQGEVLVDRNGVVIDAYYSSSGGNFSSSIENVWSLSPKHYLMPQQDYSQGSTYSSWTRSFSFSELSQKLASLGLAKVRAITVSEHSSEGRVNKALVSGSNHQGSPSHKLLIGEELRHKLKLPSTNFKIESKGTSLVFKGQGFGHGLGLSQYGAKNLAQQGESYKEILKHYYHGASLARY